METIEQLEQSIAARQRTEKEAYTAAMAELRSEFKPFVECAESELADHARLCALYGPYLAEEQRRVELLGRAGYNVHELGQRVDALARALSDLMTNGTRQTLQDIRDLTVYCPTLDSTKGNLKRAIDGIKNRTFRAHIEQCKNAVEAAKEKIRPSPIVGHGSPLAAATVDPHPDKPKVKKNYSLFRGGYE